MTAMANDESHLTLTIQKLEEILQEFREKRVFYTTSPFCQKYNDEGEEFCAAIPIGSDTVYLFHPDHLDAFIEVVVLQDLMPIEYDFKRSPMTMPLHRLNPFMSPIGADVPNPLLNISYRMTAWWHSSPMNARDLIQSEED